LGKEKFPLLSVCVVVSVLGRCSRVTVTPPIPGPEPGVMPSVIRPLIEKLADCAELIAEFRTVPESNLLFRARNAATITTNDTNSRRFVIRTKPLLLFILRFFPQRLDSDLKNQWGMWDQSRKYRIL
jgi:hypothetical protein